MEIRERRAESNEKISKRDIIIDGQTVGKVEIAFDGRVAHISNVELNSHRNERYGIKVAIQIGEELAAKGITLHSGSNISPDGIRLCDSLVRIGRMKITTHTRHENQQVYEYIPIS